MSDSKKKTGFKVLFHPFEARVDVAAGTSILEAANKLHLPLKATCGGKGTCGECRVQVLSGQYKCPASAALPEEVAKEGYVLACSTEIRDDLVVQLPEFLELPIQSVPTARFFEEYEHSISGHRQLQSVLCQTELRLPPPTLEDNYSDLTRLERELRKRTKRVEWQCAYTALKKLASAVRASDRLIITWLKWNQGGTILDVRPEGEANPIYGVACDLGTTTVALFLVDLTDGKIKATASTFNQQLKGGQDIIARINYAQRPGGLEELHNLIIATVNTLIEKAASSARVSIEDIVYAFFSGNTTMIHLFLNLDPRYIREEPYVPTVNRVPMVLSQELGLRMASEARVQCGPAVGSYVGSDITTGLLCTPLYIESMSVSLFVDIGTNGELVIGNKDWLMTCACSAGPAFEGGGIRCGMPAVPGAIERIQIKDSGHTEYRVIDGAKPKGLCGSGLVDLLAELFIQGYIDRNGKFKLEKAADYLVEEEDGLGFRIVPGRRCYWGKDLIITEKDISNLLRTKAAVFSACSLLLKNVGLKFDQIEAFYIAGGFGQTLNIESCIRIGLLPDLDRNKYHYIGNSSLLGSYLSLISETNKKMVDKMAGKMTYIELNTEPRYMNEFTGALFLPQTEMDLFPSVKRKL